jgi:hypothetical protein
LIRFSIFDFCFNFGGIMAEKSPQISKKLVRIGAVLIGLAILGVFTVIGGFVYAANQESHDPFCGSCHTQPETSYLERSTAAQQVDLASYHTSQNTKCIDCHSGSGVFGRIKAELEGAGNAFKFYTKTAVQPAVLNHPLSDQNCLKCHQNVTSSNYSPQQQISIPGEFEGGGDEARVGHWHVFLSRWQFLNPSAGRCVTCHSGHSTNVNVQNGFLNDQNVVDTCQACHQKLRGGD